MEFDIVFKIIHEMLTWILDATDKMAMILVLLLLKRSMESRNTRWS